MSTFHGILGHSVQKNRFKAHVTSHQEDSAGEPLNVEPKQLWTIKGDLFYTAKLVDE